MIISVKRVLIIPTFNESKNIIRLLDLVFQQKIENLFVVVVDDSSPDGTSDLVKQYLKSNSNIYLLNRIGTKGRGSAGILGFDFAMKLGADQIVEMDSDFSHPPEELKAIFNKLEIADIVVASRLYSGATDSRPFLRRFITTLANLYARFFLDHPTHRSHVLDWTTGYRAYRRIVFEKVPPSSLISQGPSIVQELLWRAMNQKCTAIEIPFHMVDREQGKSSFNSKVALQSILSIPAYAILFRPSAHSLNFEPNYFSDVITNEKYIKVHYR